jgi:hypothetical protein
MPFDPTPKPASEYQRGLAFGAATVMRQIDGGLPIERIRETHDAAKLTLLEAASNDDDREFCTGYSAPWTPASPPCKTCSVARPKRSAGSRPPSANPRGRPADDGHTAPLGG